MRRSNRRTSVLGLIVLGAGITLGALAQEPGQQQPPSPPPPPAQEQPSPQAPASNQPYQTEDPEQLQQLVAPIALYPDSLVASILGASSYPSEIADANSFLAARQNFTPEQIASDADKQSWAPAVKSLLAFPPVLRNLASNLSWTSELGDAYYNQPTDVMDAIQEMRRDAKKHGTLKSNDQIKVVDKHGYITIEPKNPDSQTVYVPQYDPWLAYGYPVEPWPGWVEVPGVWWDGPGLYFGAGFGLAPFWGFGWGWPYWGLDWWGRGIYWHGAPYWHGSPAFFDRDRFYRGYPGFSYRSGPDQRAGRGFEGRSPGMRSGPFSGFNHGGVTRGYSARGQSSVGGVFHGGGFGGGGFHGGGGGGFHGGGGRR